MSYQKFITINNEFLIKKSISNEILKKCFSFVANQRRIKISKIKHSYNKCILKTIKLPNNIKKKDVNIVIKSKFNKGYRFINLNKTILFYEHKNSDLNFKKSKVIN